MARTIKRSKVSVNFKEKRSINPPNMQKLGRHIDAEFKKLYDLLGENGIISQGTVQTIIIGSSGGGGTPTPTPTPSTGFSDTEIKQWSLLNACE